MAVKRKNKTGRPSKYRAEFARQAGVLCALGATDVQLAEFFEVSPTTIETWKQKEAAFAAALKSAKALADAQVEKALFARATGCKVADTYFAVIAGQVIATPTEKEYPPDVTACIFWLKNRKPSEWRDKHDHAVAGPGGEALGTGLAVEIARELVRQQAKKEKTFNH